MYVPCLGVRVGDPSVTELCSVLGVPRDTFDSPTYPPCVARPSRASSVVSLTHGPARGKCSVHLPSVASTVASRAARTAGKPPLPKSGQPASKRAAPAGKPPPPKAALPRKAPKGSAVLLKRRIPSPSARKGA